MTIIEKHKELCDRIHETCVAKNHDYGNSVNKLYNEFGLISYIVRINDKVNRINALVKTNDRQVKDEKITDTLLDLANYALLAVANIEFGEETKPTTKESIEALGYACGEIQKCFTNGWKKSLENKPFKEDKKIEKIDVIPYEKCIHEVTHKEKEILLEIRDIQMNFNKIIDYLMEKKQ